MSDTIIGSDQSTSNTGAVQLLPVRLMKSLMRGISQFTERRRNRRDLPILLALDDHALADIGLHRSDLGYIARYGKAPPHIAAADQR
jgi:uncharacterized protein YjiS (DUF1127 family)